MIRRGVSSVFDKRYIKANKELIDEFVDNGSLPYGVTLHAYNLYIGVMEKFQLPLKNFEIARETNLSEILETAVTQLATYWEFALIILII